MTDLICTVQNHTGASEITVTVFDFDSDKVLFSDQVYHGNFFNASSTRQARKSLARNAADWAEQNGYTQFAEEVEEEYGLNRN